MKKYILIILILICTVTSGCRHRVSNDFETETESSAPDPGSAEILNEEAVTGKKEETTAADTAEVVEIIDNKSDNNPDEGGGAVGVILDKYKSMLKQGLTSMYECEKGYIYFETVDDYHTVNRKNEIHQMILSSGGYNVAEKLLDDALVIDDGWLIRKNPALIVKCVDASVLGDSVTDTAAAKGIVDSIINRPDWLGISAVLSNNIILISSQLLETEEGRFTAELYMAKSMYPELFESVDVNDICNTVFMNETNGIYVYGVS